MYRVSPAWTSSGTSAVTGRSTSPVSERLRRGATSAARRPRADSGSGTRRGSAARDERISPAETCSTLGRVDEVPVNASSGGHIPFNRARAVGTEQAYIAEAIARGQLSAGGPFTDRCCRWLETEVGCEKAVLVHSATAALEMAALLLEIEPGDEVVMPSFAFVSSANAFVLRGVVPVFVDVRADTFNLDETLVEDAFTSRTRAIVPVHYAGVPCELDAICDIASSHDVTVVEDAAQALGSTHRGRPAGSLGELAAVSFHETKNVTSAEGGALLVNEARFAERAEV